MGIACDEDDNELNETRMSESASQEYRSLMHM